jgi:hypothetical protein
MVCRQSLPVGGEVEAVTDEPLGDPRLVKAIEACRPQGDDLSQPELAFFAIRLAASAELKNVVGRVQETDAAIGRVFRDVPAPNGLSDRLLARLAEARQASPPAAITEVPTRRLRRPLTAAALLATVLAASILLIFLPSLRRHAVSLAEIQARVMARFQTELDERPTGQLLSSVAAPRNLPPSQDLVALPGMRWRELPGLLGGRTIAYDMTVPGGTRATLYVVRPPSGLSSLPSGPPPTPTPMTQGRSIAAWKKATPSGDLLYVLAVDGGTSSYRSLLRVARMPVA